MQGLLQHLGWTCPGLQGPGSRQDIRPATFAELFSSEQIEIPLFQRTYCWGSGSSCHRPQYGAKGQEVRLVDAWWRDAHRASKSNKHRVGKIVFKRRAQQSNEAPPLMCLDGQQRCTTNLLLVAALRDAALATIEQEPEHPKGKLIVERLNSILYTDSAAAHAWVERAMATQCSIADMGNMAGEACQWSRLIPSRVDRAAYFTVIMSGLLQAAGAQHGQYAAAEEIHSSHQWQAKVSFDKLIQALLEQHNGIEQRLTALQHAAEKALEGMSLMYIEILNDVDLAQVFLWMQEKSLFSAGSFLFNPQPGISFQGGDLVRNLMLSAFMHLPTPEQEELYFSLWLEPIELKCSGKEELEQRLESFLEHKTGLRLELTKPAPRTNGPRQKPLRLPPRELLKAEPATTQAPRESVTGEHGREWHAGAFEKLVYDMAAAEAPCKVAQMRGALLYSRFVTLLEQLHQRVQAMAMPPPSVGEPEGRGDSEIHQSAARLLLQELGQFFAQV